MGMPAYQRHRQVAACLLVSAGLHLLGVWLIHVLIPPEVEERLFRVRVPSFMPRLPERFKPRPAIPVPRVLLERLRAEAKPAALDLEVGDGVEDMLPGEEILLLDEGEKDSLVAEKGAWRTLEDTLPDASLGLLEQMGELPLGLDLVELEAEARRRTVVLIDPETRKLMRAYLHLPCWKNRPPLDLRGKELWEILDLIRRGWRLPGHVPVFGQIRYFPHGHRLRSRELQEFVLLLEKYIGVESMQVLARYLIEGGFAVTNPGSLSLLQRELQKQRGDRSQRVLIELGHPLFHAYYDIDRYVPGGPCPGTGPLSGLELDGRLVAVVGPPFTRNKPCPANKLYVNVLAYALIQPSPMGGRYLSRR
jgi:hypothetical protein